MSVPSAERDASPQTVTPGGLRSESTTLDRPEPLPSGAAGVSATRSTRGALLLGARQLLTILLSASAAVLLARWLEPADYGMFATLNLIVFGAATLLGDLGLTVSLVRQVDEPRVEEWAAANRLVTGMATAGVLGGAVGVAVLLQLGRDQLALWVGVLALALGARFLRAMPSARLQRQQRFATLAVIETVESVFYFATVLVLARSGQGAGSLAIAVGVKELLGYSAQRFAARGGPRLRGVQGRYRELLSVGLPVQASGLLIAVTDMFQPLFIGGVLGLTALGHVSWAYNLVLMPILLLGAIDRVVLPSLARVQEDRTLLALLTARAIRLNTLVAFPVVIGVLVAPSELVSLVFDPQWLPAADLLVLFVPAIVTTAMTSPLFHAFNAIGRTRIAMWLSASWLVVTWSAGALATWQWGTTGFGWFYVLLQFAYLPVWRLARRELGVDVLGETKDALVGLALGVTVGSTVAASLGDASRWGALVAGVGTGIVVFLAVVALYEGARTRADVTFLVTSVLGRRGVAPTPTVDTVVEHTAAGSDPAAGERPWRLQHIPAFDGLRALAVLAVMVHHAHVPFMDGGFLGVDVFFVLSGFLITALLVQERDRNGTVDVWRFYARRSLRLFPALLVMVAVVTPILLVWDDGELRSNSLETIPWTLGYLTNYLAMIVERGLGVFGHTWSLAIEEQFYLLWPPALLLMLHRRSPRFAAGVAVAGAGVVAVGRAVTWIVFENVEYTYFALHARADALLIGCAVALMMTHMSTADVERLARRCARPAVVVGALLLALAAVATATAGWVYVVGLLLAALCSVFVIAQIAGHPDSTVARLLSWRPLVFVGSISYGVYLWHFPVFELVKDAVPGTRFVVLVAVQFAGSFAAALLSWFVVERPTLRWKNRLRR